MQMQMMWEEPSKDAQTCRNGAKCFLQSVPRTKLQQLCQALALSGEGSNLDMADQIAQRADRPYAILAQLPEKMLQRAVAEYRLACGQEGCSNDDSDDKVSAIAHLELQCEAVMLWGKFGVRGCRHYLHKCSQCMMMQTCQKINAAKPSPVLEARYPVCCSTHDRHKILHNNVFE